MSISITQPPARTDAEIANIPTDINEKGIRAISHIPSANLRLNGANNLGMLLIELPVGWIKTMLKFTLSIYLHSGGSSLEDSCDLQIGGYTWVTEQWNNTIVSKMNSGLGTHPWRIRFGKIAGTPCIVVDRNNDASSFSYPQFAIKDLQLGFLGVDNPAWDTWPQMRIITDLNAEQITLQNNQPPLIPADIGNP